MCPENIMTTKAGGRAAEGCGGDQLKGVLGRPIEGKLGQIN